MSLRHSSSSIHSSYLWTEAEDSTSLSRGSKPFSYSKFSCPLPLTCILSGLFQNKEIKPTRTVAVDEFDDEIEDDETACHLEWT